MTLTETFAAILGACEDVEQRSGQPATEIHLPPHVYRAFARAGERYFGSLRGVRCLPMADLPPHEIRVLTIAN